MQNQIPNNWRQTELGEVIKITRGASPRPIQDYLSSEGMPWVKIADATASNSKFIENTKEYIKLNGVKNSVVVEKGELIISNSATPGIPKFMKIRACVHDGWLIFRDFKDIFPEYTYYFMLWARKKLVSKTTGSVFDNLKTDIVKNFPIKLPSMAIQQKIASILSSFDDKIELNNKIAKTLEEMAQAIFKEWFVKSVNSEKLKVKSGIMKDITIITTGKRPNKLFQTKKENFNIPVYGAKGIMGYTDKTLYNQKIIITGRVGTIGEVSIIDESSWPSDNALILIPKNSNYLYLLYFLMKGINYLSLNRGSSQPLIAQSDIENYFINLPDETHILKFNSLVSKLFLLINNKRKENQKLAAMRNLLLPKLMKGEIRA